MKEAIHPKYSRRRRALRVRRDLEDPFDQTRAAPRNLLELPPVLHRQAEADGHRRPRRAVQQEVRRADVGEPQSSGKGQEGSASRRPVTSPVSSLKSAVRQTADLKPQRFSFVPSSSLSGPPDAERRRASPVRAVLQAAQGERLRRREIAHAMLMMDRERGARFTSDVPRTRPQVEDLPPAAGRLRRYERERRSSSASDRSASTRIAADEGEAGHVPSLS